MMGVYNARNMYSEPSSGIKLTAYSCVCWLFHRIYYDAENHKHKKKSNKLRNILYTGHSEMHTTQQLPCPAKQTADMLFNTKHKFHMLVTFPNTEAYRNETSVS